MLRSPFKIISITEILLWLLLLDRLILLAKRTMQNLFTVAILLYQLIRPTEVFSIKTVFLSVNGSLTISNNRQSPVRNLNEFNDNHCQFSRIILLGFFRVSHYFKIVYQCPRWYLMHRTMLIV